MRVPPEVEHLVKEGASLSADGAEAMERVLDARPDDVEARARLLGHYQARARERYESSTPAERFAQANVLISEGGPHHEARARHAAWLAANAPRVPLAAHDLCHFSRPSRAYVELSAIWRRNAEADPSDATVLAHAIAFFWEANEFFADELLARAEETFPDDSRWVRFRQERRARELIHDNLVDPLRDRGLVPGEGTDRGKDERRARRLADIERLFREAGPEPPCPSQLHRIAGTTALALGDVESARSHAEHLLLVSKGECEREGTDAAHDGHLLLGRVALRDADVERAKAHLMLAGRAGATGLVRVFGPDMRLARELLVRGERDIVLRYLMLVRGFWERGPVDHWIAEIRLGRLPDFGRNIER
jgi:hypothetical protein